MDFGTNTADLHWSSQYRRKVTYITVSKFCKNLTFQAERLCFGIVLSFFVKMTKMPGTLFHLEELFLNT